MQSELRGVGGADLGLVEAKAAAGYRGFADGSIGELSDMGNRGGPDLQAVMTLLTWALL